MFCRETPKIRDRTGDAGQSCPFHVAKICRESKLFRHYCPVRNERNAWKRLIHNGFSAIFGGVGLKLVAVSPTLFRGGSAHERRKDAIFAADGLPTLEHSCADRRSL